MTPNYERFKEYLLGGLSVEERENLELQIIDDPDFGTEALVAEEHLIESYVGEELSPSEADRFRSQYLITDERLKRLKEFAAFRAAIVDQPRLNFGTEEKHVTNRVSLFERLRPFTVVAVGALVLIVASLLLYKSVIQRPSTIESEYAAMNSRDMSDLNALSEYSKVELTPGTFRGGDAGDTLRPIDLTESALFRLHLGFDPPPDARYRVLVLRDDRQIFEVGSKDVVRNESVKEVRVLLPKKIFERGQYVIRLEQYESSNAPVVFNFTVK